MQEVGRRALTVTCRACNKPLQIGDLKVKNYDARRKVQTTGSLVVEKKGQIVSDAVECGTAVVRGTIKTKHGTVVRGTALVGPGAQVVGDFKCQRLAVGAGASLDGFYVVGRDEMTPPPPNPRRSTGRRWVVTPPSDVRVTCVAAGTLGTA